MANKKVEFLSTAAGSYGVANTGDKLVVSASVATQLEKQGTVKVLGDSSDDESVPQAGSLRIADETGKGTAPAGETDPKNPTGADIRTAAPKKASRKR